MTATRAGRAIHRMSHAASAVHATSALHATSAVERGAPTTRLASAYARLDASRGQVVLASSHRDRTESATTSSATTSCAATSYSSRLRVLLCRHCAAPLPSAVGGGRVGCDDCRGVQRIAPRDDRALALELPLADVHVARFRGQGGEPLRAPSALSHLARAGQLDPDRLDEALRVFLSTRDEVERFGSAEAAERLRWLTLLLASHFAATREHRRRRALLETALSAFALPHHAQVVRCVLAEAALSEGDVEAAVAWLGPCRLRTGELRTGELRTGELESDSALRVASALVHTAKGELDAVLRLVGRVDGQVPIQDAREPMAAVLRANALEGVGEPEAAVAALLDRMRREDGVGRRAMEAFVAAHPELAMCRRSLPRATAAFLAERARATRRYAVGAWSVWLAALGLGVLALVTWVSATWGSVVASGPLPNVAPNGASHMAGVLALPIGAVFLSFLGGRLWAGARRRARRLHHAVSAWGVVTAIDPTGLTMDELAQVRVRVRVGRAGAADEVSCLAMHTPAFAARVALGAEVAILIDPAHPERAFLDLD